MPPVGNFATAIIISITGNPASIVSEGGLSEQTNIRVIVIADKNTKKK